MQDEMGSDISASEIIQKIKDEALRRRCPADAAGAGSGSAHASGSDNRHYNSAGPADNMDKIYFPKQGIDLLINDVRAKSQIRTKIPDALNRFPVNKSKLLKRVILKLYELLFREQRAVNNAMVNIIQEFSSVHSKTIAEINAMQAVLQAKFGELDGRVSELDGRVSRANRDIFRQIKDHKLNIIDMQRRLALFLEDARKRFPEPFSASQIENMLKEEGHIFDAMYAAFEDKFRGTRQDIKDRQKVYLPFVQEASGKTAGAPIIDLGCGRGEWLELLRESGFMAKGIDLNNIMINTCRELNLDAVQSDAIEYLRSLPANSLCAVTGFHIIEHLPFKTLVALFDESFRALKPGGAIIFETPNPENLLVGACTFYADPSHVKPLVPATMQFIAEDRGFSGVEIKRLHRYSDYHNVSGENKFITENFYNEMDYSVIGVKL